MKVSADKKQQKPCSLVVVKTQERPGVTDETGTRKARIQAIKFSQEEKNPFKVCQGKRQESKENLATVFYEVKTEIMF